MLYTRFIYLGFLFITFNSCNLSHRQVTKDRISYERLSYNYQEFLRTEDSTYIYKEIQNVISIVNMSPDSISDSACFLIPTYLMHTKKYEALITFLEKKHCGSNDQLLINLAKHLLSEELGDFNNNYMRANLQEIESRIAQNPADSFLLFDYFLCQSYIVGLDSIKQQLDMIIATKSGDSQEFYNEILENTILSYNRNPDSTR